MITGLSHVSIAVPSLEAAAKRLKELYGLAVGEPMVNEQQGVRLAYVELGNARIELMEPSRPDSPISKFLEHNPARRHPSLLSRRGRASWRPPPAIAGKGARVLGEAGKTQTTCTASASLSCIRRIFSARWWSWKSTRRDDDDMASTMRTLRARIAGKARGVRRARVRGGGDSSGGCAGDRGADGARRRAGLGGPRRIPAAAVHPPHQGRRGQREAAASASCAKPPAWRWWTATTAWGTW